MRLASEGMSNVVVSNLPHLDKSALTAPHQGHATGDQPQRATFSEHTWQGKLQLVLTSTSWTTTQ